MMYSTLAAAKDPWVPYDKGKKAITPEPATYGLLLVGLCLLLVLLARLDKGGSDQ